MNAFFFDTPFHEAWLKTFRSGTGLILLISFLCLIPDLQLLYAEDGFADPALLRLQQGVSYLSFHILPVNTWVCALYALLCIALTGHLFSRPCSLILLFLHDDLFIGRPGFSYGFDYIASSCLLYCLLFSSSTQGNTFYLRVLQAHVCIIYLFAGLGKLLGFTWLNGEAVWKALQQPGYESPFKPDLMWLAPYPALWTVAGWLVLLMELGYPLFIWLTPTRKYWLWAIIGLHVGIALFLGLYFFSAIMILLNLCAFYYPYLTTPANQKQLSIPMVSPLSQPAAADETRGEAGGPIQTPPDDMA